MNDLYDKGKKYYEIGKYHKAIKIMKKVSKTGNADAPAILGFIYIVKKKYKKVVYWLTIAAERGNSEAQYELACLYDEGVEIPWNPEKAFHWFMELAKADNSSGMFEVGRLYAVGEGVEKNNEKALYWLEKSANGGNKGAVELLEKYKSSNL